MFRKKEERRKQVIPNMKGGLGEFQLEHIIDSPEELGNKGRLYATGTLPSGSSVGMHTHEGDMEICHFLSGTGTVKDGDKEYMVKAGDVNICFNGKNHEIINNSSEDLIYTVLVLYAE